MVYTMQSEIAHDGILNGKALAAAIRRRMAAEVAEMRAAGHVPVLAVVRVGDDPASKVYVGAKHRACAEVGVGSRKIELGEDTTEADLLAVVAQLNGDPEVDGILVQLPLPGHIDAEKVTRAVAPGKDADGFHPDNLGDMFTSAALLEPCTPRGCMALLAAAGVELRGLSAVVVGRSIIVGRPVAQMLLRRDATVTICHRHTRNLEELVRGADVVIAATGVRNLVHGEWIKPGAVVIDVGINRDDQGRLCGDVEFETAHKNAAWITPVPGGVGPMTVATLIWNTLLAARRRRGLPLSDNPSDWIPTP
jgi:methylenetetrahydrofolate dehydrogenase (NADP+)/methenyltetrahydrofolate cyclohydrolase